MITFLIYAIERQPMHDRTKCASAFYYANVLNINYNHKHSSYAHKTPRAQHTTNRKERERGGEWSWRVEHTITGLRNIPKMHWSNAGITRVNYAHYSHNLGPHWAFILKQIALKPLLRTSALRQHSHTSNMMYASLSSQTQISRNLFPAKPSTDSWRT